jgi:hypothetical protein
MAPISQSLNIAMDTSRAPGSARGELRPTPANSHRARVVAAPAARRAGPAAAAGVARDPRNYPDLVADLCAQP